MLCMSEVSKEHTYTFLLITFLIFNRLYEQKGMSKVSKMMFAAVYRNVTHVRGVQSELLHVLCTMNKRSKGMSKVLKVLYTHINRMKSLPLYVHRDEVTGFTL